MKSLKAPEKPNSGSREIPLKRRYLEKVKSGKKTLELRIGFPSFQSIKTGDCITFVCDADSVVVHVRDIRRYSDMKEMIRSEDIKKMALEMNWEEIREAIKRIFNEDKIKRFGLLVFEIQLLD